MPRCATELLRGGAYRGDLIKVSEPQSREDISDNFVWLLPAVKQLRDRVGSAYLYADALLELDELWKGTVLIPRTGFATKAELAIYEGGKLKKLHGRPREMFRNAGGSRCDKIRELKSFMQPRERPLAVHPITDAVQARGV